MLLRRRQLLTWFTRRNAIAFAGGEVSWGLSTRTLSSFVGGMVQGLTMTVTSPLDGATITFPFDASGTATAGATVTCYNDGTGAVLGTATSVAGAWTMTISGTA
jgi:hypothetical protein